MCCSCDTVASPSNQSSYRRNETGNGAPNVAQATNQVAQRTIQQVQGAPEGVRRQAWGSGTENAIAPVVTQAQQMAPQPQAQVRRERTQEAEPRIREQRRREPRAEPMNPFMLENPNELVKVHFHPGYPPRIIGISLMATPQIDRPQFRIGMTLTDYESIINAQYERIITKERILTIHRDLFERFLHSYMIRQPEWSMKDADLMTMNSSNSRPMQEFPTNHPNVPES